jgi:hypothetical protein
VTGDTQSAIDAVAGAGGFVPGAARRLGPWIAGREVPDASAIAAIARAFRRRGSSVVGWCPDDPVADRPEAAAVAPAVSSSTFPVGAR